MKSSAKKVKESSYERKEVGQFRRTTINVVRQVINFNWGTGLFILLTPFVSMYGFYSTPLHPYTIAIAVLSYMLGMMGTTAGYHRCFAHRTYETYYPIKFFMMLFGTSALSMSVIDWCLDHRAHHKYTDSEKDPYNAKKGFWYCHVGWLLWKRKMPNSDISDIMSEHGWVLRIQHALYLPIGFAIAWALPIYICGHFWDDWWGGFYFASVFKSVLLHHGIFCINSYAHMFGETTFTDQFTPRDSLFAAILTTGEGYHNFHHEFPNDYRNGIHWNAYDPTKWFIATLEYLGLAWDLKRTPECVIEKARLLSLSKKVEQKRSTFFWGAPIESLPYYTKDDIQRKSSRESLVVMDKIVYDVKEFVNKHPGGNDILSAYIGKDITYAFNGGVYKHTHSAKNILDTLRVGRCKDDLTCQ